jgi:hypothetical protein
VKINLIIALFICLNSEAAEYAIEKYETELQKLATKKASVLQTQKLKILKSRQVILEKYYNELQTSFDYQMRTKNLTLANKVNAKKEEIYVLYQSNKESIANPLKKSKEGVNSSKVLKLLQHKDVHNSYSAKEIVNLKIGGRCFKAAGEKQSDEIWKTIPKFLLGKKISYLSRDDDTSSYSASYEVKKSGNAGYLYNVNSTRSNGAEELGIMVTNAGRVFYVYKYYLYKSNSLYIYCRSGSEQFAIFEP